MNNILSSKAIHRLPSILLVVALILAHGIAPAFSSETLQRSSSGLTAVLSSAGAAVVSVDTMDKSLNQVMQEIHTRCGAEVRVPQALAADKIFRSVRGVTWQNAISQLLEGYNYSAVWGEGGRPIQLTVYSRNQYLQEPAAVAATATTLSAKASGELLIYESFSSELPKKYQALNPASVSPVSLPVERMKEMAEGEKVSLNLPCGQFEVVYEQQYRRENGDVAWMGHVEGTGGAYNVAITLGKAGSHGQVATPEGAYNLESVDGKTFLVEVDAFGLEAGTEQVASKLEEKYPQYF